MKVEDLKFDKRNYRRHSEKNQDLIKKSINEVGFGRSIVIDADNEIVCGNGVVSQIAKSTPIKVVETNGSELVVVKRTDLKTDDAKRKQLAVMDNSTSDSSDFDLTLLQEDFTNEELEDWGLDVDFAIEEEEKEVIEDEVPETVETRCKLGDIWQLGEHRLMCGDSTKADDVEKLMNGEKADMVFTDPPYNVNYSGRGEQNKLGTIKNDNMSEDAFNQFCNDFFESYYTLLKPLGCIYVCHPDSQSLPKIAFEINFAKFFKKSSTIIWLKQSAGMGWQDYRSQHEPILYGWKEGEGKHNFFGDRTNTTVWDIKRENVSGYVHPTQKPIALPAKAIKNNSKEKDIVSDLFGGSGSTLIACEQLNRKCYTMELDEKYCDVILQRWENLTGKKAVLCS